MAQKLVVDSRLNSSLSYDGYDPTWIIGTHGDQSSPSSYIYGEHVTVAWGSVQHSQSSSGLGYSRGFLDQYDPHKRVATADPYSRLWPHGDSGLKPSTPVKASSAVAPIPVVKILYPHGHGHDLGHGHGYKNIVVMKVPVCCEGCEEKWKDNLTSLPGFDGVNVDRRHAGMKLKVTVFGHMETHSVVKAVQRVQPRAEFWG